MGMPMAIIAANIWKNLEVATQEQVSFRKIVTEYFVPFVPLKIKTPILGTQTTPLSATAFTTNNFRFLSN